MHELLAWQSGDDKLPQQIVTVLYFLLFILLCVFLLLNFVIAIVIDRFAWVSQPDAMRVDSATLRKLRVAWGEVADELHSRTHERWCDTYTSVGLYLPSYSIISLLLRLPSPLGVRDAAWLRGCDAVEFGERMIPLVRAMHLHENTAGRLFYLDAARALCARGAVAHDDMTLHSIEQGVQNKLRVDMAAGASARLVRAAFAEQHEQKQSAGFRPLAALLGRFQRWRGSRHGSAAAAAAEAAVRQAHRGSLSHADQLHPVDLTDAFNAANALQALWRGVLMRRRDAAELQLARSVRNPMQPNHDDFKTRTRSFDMYSAKSSAPTQRMRRQSTENDQRRHREQSSTVELAPQEDHGASALGASANRVKTTVL